MDRRIHHTVGAVAALALACAIQAAAFTAEAGATAGVKPGVTFSAPSSVTANPAPSASFAVTGSEPSVTTTCHFDVAASVPCSSPFAYAGAPLADGKHSFTVTATDSEGDVRVAIRNFTVDTAVPLLAIDSPRADTRTSEPALAVEFSFFDDTGPAVPECVVDAAAPVLCGGSPYRTPTLAVGAHTITVRATDPAGNANTTAVAVEVIDPGDPTIDLTLAPSTRHVAAHPDLRATLVNETGGDLRELRIGMPDGLVGSLKAVTTRCPFAQEPDYTDFKACDADTLDGSQIGRADVSAQVDDSTGRLYGQIYLTDPPTGSSGVPAGVAIVTPLKINELEMGEIVMAGTLTVRPQLFGSATDTSRLNTRGVDLTIDSIPASITDIHGTTEFTVRRAVVDLWSDIDNGPGGPPPLLTNPSKCAVAEMVVNAGIDDADPDEAVDFNHYVAGGYTTTGCDHVRFAPTVSMSVSDNDAGDLTDVDYEIELPDGSATVKEAIIDLPPSLITNFAALSSESDCAKDDTAKIPIACDASHTQVGTLTVETPMLPTPLEGQIYLEESGGNIPNMYARIVDATLGIDLRMRGQLRVLGPSGLGSFVRARINSNAIGQAVDVPDLPVSSISMSLTGAPSEQQIQRVNSECLASDAGAFRFTAHSGQVVSGTIPLAFDDCPAHELTITSPDVAFGATTTDDSPSFAFAVSGEDPGTEVQYFCALDSPGHIGSAAPTAAEFNFGEDPCAVSSPPATGDPAGYTTSGLANGTHTLAVRAQYAGGLGEDTNYYSFTVDKRPPFDDDVPETEIAAGQPSETPLAQPSFAFSSPDGDAEFQCRFDAGDAFQPCSSPQAPAEPLRDGLHTLEVRAEDPSGNVDLTPAEHEFTVALPFAPVFTATPSTYQARAHPTFNVHVEHSAAEDLKRVDFELPDGLMGSLQAVTQRCSAAGAQAASCPAASRVGTVQLTAAADRSTVVVDGDVFMTDPLAPGEPAGLVAIVDAAVGAVDFDPVAVPIHLGVKPGARGLTASSGEIPNTIVDPATGTTVSFDLRAFDVELTGGVGAPEPLITNPSSCAPASFAATFTGYLDSVAPAGDGFQATGCDALPFESTLSASIADVATGGVPRAGALLKFKTRVSENRNGASIRRATVTLPNFVSVKASLLPLACTNAQQQAGACPQSSQIGTATAVTPLLAAPVAGPVYLLQAVPGQAGSVLRFLVQLNGPITVEVIGGTDLVGGRLVTVFDDLPDVPIETFDLDLNPILVARKTACAAPTERHLTGSAVGANGKTVAYNAPLALDCAGDPIGYSFSGKLTARGARSTLALAVKREDDFAKIKRLRIVLPRGVKLNRRALARAITVTGDRRKLRGCFTAQGTTTVTITLCGRAVRAVTLKLAAGALRGPRRIKRGAFKVTATDADSVRLARTLELDRRLRLRASP